MLRHTLECDLHYDHEFLPYKVNGEEVLNGVTNRFCASKGDTVLIYEGGTPYKIFEVESKSIDIVNHPPHYISHPSGIECIQVTEHMNFCLGNAMKYIWRADEKGNSVEDLKKAVWYINREIERRENGN